MLNTSAVGLSVKQTYTYTQRDVILYNLSVGAGSDDLKYVYEKGLKALPTFGVIPCTATYNTEPFREPPYMPTELMGKLRTDGTMHMEHVLEIYRPIPVEGKLYSTKTISAVYDRGPGKGAMLVTDVDVCDENGEKYCSNRMSFLYRWYDSFGGERPPKMPSPIPEREPDKVMEGRFAENSSLLYRLTGDTNPMHADPEVSAKAGFPKPVQHGLCSLGYASRMLTENLAGDDPDRVLGVSVRFAGVTYPGDGFKLLVWNTGEGEAAFRMVNAETGKIILDRGIFKY